jgi:tetratricopeptide (TPR) repeat protein
VKRWGLIAAAAALLLAQTGSRDPGRLFEQRKYAEAAALLEEQLRERPQDFAAQMLLGLCRQQLGEPAKAEVSFIAAVRLQPANAGAHYALARIRFFLGRFDQALADAADAERLGEPPARVAHLRGRIEEERGRFREALVHYRGAREADSKMIEAASGEASVLYKLGKYAEARQSAEYALRLDPRNAEAKRVLEQAARAVPVEAGAAPAPVRFVRKEGIDFRLEHFPTPQKHLISTMTGGLAVFDFDGDGLPDLFFANGAEIPSLKKTGPRFWNRLYRNAGGWRFEDVTERQRVQGEGFSMGAAAADFDNDGRIDLFVPGVGRSLLYRNTPQGFIEIGKAAGVRDERWPVAAAWLDYDRDGWLDLFVVNYLDWSPEAERYCGDREKGVRVYCHPREYAGLPNRLYRNRHDGTFEDVSGVSGIAKHTGKGMSAAVIDADADGWPDVFVTNDSEPNFLFRNRGDGTFEQAALQYGAAFNDEGKAVSSMGVDARDYNNDGLPDLVITALSGENFLLLRNTGRKVFQDVTFPSRLGLTAVRRSGWGVVLADLNNDGWKDLFTANSHVTDNIERIRNERYLEPNSVFLNRNGAFTTVQEVGPPAAHRGAAIADLDGDGRLDAVVTTLGGKPELWRNEGEAGNWIRVRLEGQSLGTRIRVGSQWQERTSASGYSSSNLDAVHFGIGPATEVSEVRVVWPGGQVQTLENVKAGQTLVVRLPAQP